MKWFTSTRVFRTQSTEPSMFRKRPSRRTEKLRLQRRCRYRRINREACWALFLPGAKGQNLGNQPEIDYPSEVGCVDSKVQV
jgi:hypothetical protein